MNELVRPNPDALLASLKEDEERQKRGKLKIFFGMSPGVGKTYAMLLEARRDVQAGTDLVVGVVETHKRKETEALLQGLTVIPRRHVSYRGVELQEMDLDAILVRSPRVVLVDEMAHTNAPGSRHPKRYQDIEELLDAGISVYSTLNVQHLETRADIVRQITGAGVQETVPDSIFERADEIQLVDLTPDDLRERLAEGRVYLGDAANVAAHNFFKPENLTALREMALRVAAEHTDSALRGAMRDRGIPGPWKAGERLLVGITASPSSESLIRWTRRMAGALNCSWMAVCVETDAPLAEEDKNRIARHFSVARQLGAEVMTVAGQRPAEAILRVARENNVTQIVVGKSQEPWWRVGLRGGSLAQQLISQSGLIDIYVVQPDKTAPLAPRARAMAPPPSRGDWLEAAAVTGALTALFLLVSRVVGYYAIGPLYLLWVVVAALRYRRPGVALVVGAACAVLWNFLFIPPRFTFIISTFHDATMFFMFFAVSLAIGQLTARLRASEFAEQRRERRTATLFDLARQTALARDLDAGLTAAARLLENLLQASVALTLRLPDRTLSPVSHPAGSLKLAEKEYSVAAWVFVRRSPAGRFTDTLPDSEALHLPLQSPTGIFGILSIQPTQGRSFDLGERDLLDAAASLIAAILEKHHFIEAFQRAELLEASENLRRALLDSVSHELKTPLAALQTGLDTLLFRIKPDETTRESVTEIRAALRRLQRVIGNLLDMTRIQAGVIRPRLDWTDVEEMIRSAVDLAGDSLGQHQIEIKCDDGMAMVKLDQALMEQALCNLLMNAATWSPANSHITVEAQQAGGDLVLSVLDEGSGIPASDLERVFEKFFRAPTAPTGGAGLGLSIVRGFVGAHGGTVSAANRAGGGACFTLRMPVETMNANVQESPA